MENETSTQGKPRQEQDEAHSAGTMLDSTVKKAGTMLDSTVKKAGTMLDSTVKKAGTMLDL
jgi:hypothetical protein